MVDMYVHYKSPNKVVSAAWLFDHGCNKQDCEALKPVAARTRTALSKVSDAAEYACAHV